MKTYVVTTGAIFALLTAVHVWRITQETHLATEPSFLLTTLASAALCVWAWLVVRRSARP